ncbi:MAG: hypothetical protein WC307_02360 [Candidatus Nanoarchaeia archaeon]|jgi:hypothetical protein
MAKEFSDNLGDKANEDYQQTLEIIFSSILDPLFELQNDVFELKGYVTNVLPDYIKKLVTTGVEELYVKIIAFFNERDRKINDYFDQQRGQINQPTNIPVNSYVVGNTAIGFKTLDDLTPPPPPKKLDQSFESSMCEVKNKQDTVRKNIIDELKELFTKRGPID